MDLGAKPEPIFWRLEHQDLGEQAVDVGGKLVVMLLGRLKMTPFEVMGDGTLGQSMVLAPIDAVAKVPKGTDPETRLDRLEREVGNLVLRAFLNEFLR